MFVFAGHFENFYGPAFSRTLTPPPPSIIPGSAPVLNTTICTCGVKSAEDVLLHIYYKNEIFSFIVMYIFFSVHQIYSSNDIMYNHVYILSLWCEYELQDNMCGKYRKAHKLHKGPTFTLHRSRIKCGEDK